MKNRENELKEYFAEMKKVEKNLKTSVDNIPTPVSYAKEMSEINKFIKNEFPNDFFDKDKEWIEKFKIWFSYNRNRMQELTKNNEKCDIDGIIRMIESGIPPKPTDIHKDVVLTILGYFAKRNYLLIESDCIWIFTCLSLVNGMDFFVQTECASIQSLKQLIYKTIKSINITEQPKLYSYLELIAIIIVKYFDK